MSRAGSDKDRVALDAYFTPLADAITCVGVLSIPSGVTVWEPHAGNGSFVTALKKAGHFVVASDIDPDALALRGLTLENGAIIDAEYPADRVFCADALDITPALPEGLDFRPEWVVGNPPYGILENCVKAALSRALDGVAFLIRLNFFGGQERALTMWKNGVSPAYIWILPKRPAFVAVCKGIDGKKGCGRKYAIGSTKICTCGGNVSPGTDATEYCFAIWWTDSEYQRVHEEETRGCWSFDEWRMTFPRVRWL